MLTSRKAWLSQGPSAPVGNEEISKYLKQARPTLGICLKRYGIVDGKTVRKNTEVDIPIDIHLPHFIEDDEVADRFSPLVRNFTLSLQSVICHRGNSLTGGHYVSYIRATTQIGDSASSQRLSTEAQLPEYPVERWLRHDDLNNPRVTKVANIQKELKDEMSYLLFYQVQPVFEPPTQIEPPAYSVAGIDVNIFE